MSLELGVNEAGEIHRTFVQVMRKRGCRCPLTDADPGCRCEASADVLVRLAACRASHRGPGQRVADVLREKDPQID